MPSADLSRIRADLDAIREMFRMDLHKLGDDLCRAATDGVKATLAAQQAPDGTPWAPLSPAYAEWKGKHFPGQPMAHLHELMARDDEVEGEVRVHPDAAEVTYGRSQVARDEAEFFQEGGGNQPPRPFFDFTRDSIAACDKILDDRFSDTLK